MPALKSVIRLSEEYYYLPSHLSFQDAGKNAVIDPATQRPLKLSASEAAVFQFLLSHFDTGVTRAELEHEFPDLSNPYNRTLDRLRREKLEGKLGLYRLILKKNGTVRLNLPESPFLSPQTVRPQAKPSPVNSVHALSQSLILQYAESVNNIDDTAEYVKPYIPMDFTGLIAKHTQGLSELDKRAVSEKGIDPTVYEIFFAQKIARTSEMQEFTHVLQLIHMSPDCWRVFVNSDLQVVGYWIFVCLNPAAYAKFMSGKMNEKELTIQDVRFPDMPGWYKGYLLLSGVIAEHRTPPVTSKVYHSWLQMLENYSCMGIFFTEIASMVSSYGGVSSLRNIGMTQYAEYQFGGKMFRYRLTEIEKIPFLKNHYPLLLENYRKELEKHDRIPVD